MASFMQFGRDIKSKEGKKEIFKLFWAFRRVFFALMGFSFLINLCMLASPLYMLQVYDRVLISRNEETLIFLTLIMLGVFLLYAFLDRVRNMVMIRVGNSIDASMIGRIFSVAFERSLRFGSANSTQAFHDFTNIRQFITGSGLFAFFDAPWTPIYIGVIFMLHPVLGIFSVFSGLFLFGMALITELVSKKPLDEANKAYTRATAFVGVNMRNAEAIEAMGMLGSVKNHWSPKHKLFLKMQTEASGRAGAISAVTKFARMAFQSLILGLGAYLCIKNEITPGGMIAGSILLGKALGPVEMAIGVWKQLLAARTSYDRLGEMFELFPERNLGMSLPKPTGKVSISGIFVAPPGTQQQVLRGINFNVAEGEMVCVIGPSASGKSSLARTIVGVWRPLSGVVRLDGADISQWNRDEVGGYIGYLPQDIELLDGTIAENIARFGAIDSAGIVEAAKTAGIHEMILQFPSGYNTQVGEGGSVLSGGQRQRLALARAVYGSPVLIVLDEPNSNLDEAGEVALLNALLRLKTQKKTVFVITHRTPILSIADKILLLVGGAQQMYGPGQEVLTALQQARQAAAQPREQIDGGTRL